MPKQYRQFMKDNNQIDLAIGQIKIWKIWAIICF